MPGGCLRIAVVSMGSPFERASWSGIPFYALRELRRRFRDVVVIDTPRIDKALGRTSSLSRLGLLVLREPIVTAAFARHLNRRLEAIRADVVISIGADYKVAYIDPQWRVIHVADGLFAPIINYYPRYRRLSARTRRTGDKVQAHLIGREQPIAVTSTWAAWSAAEAYGVPVSRFKVAPIGANLDTDPGMGALRPNSGPLRLLFVGYDWRRKGGDIVAAAFNILRTRLPDAELHIVGCDPAEVRGVPGVVIHGPLSKAEPGQSETLSDSFREANFLFMPSREEAYGLVYCEACAYGLPPVARDTGGVGTIIRHRWNGLLLDTEADAQAYADEIAAIWSDGARYAAMQTAAREAFETHLNWTAWGAEIEALVRPPPIVGEG